MKWWEILGVIVGVGALIQILNWFFSFMNIENDSLSFLISTIYALLVIIILIQYQNQKDTKEITDFLKEKGFKKEEGFVNDMFKKNKRGVIDPRILWIIIILIILYLLSKSGFFS